MHPGWLLLALVALVAWSGQRLLSKIALHDLGTRKFYLLSAAVSLIVYVPYLALRPPSLIGLAPALGLACLMAVTFYVTTEAIRRGPLSIVSPLTALSPTLTAALAIGLLSERLAWPAYLGIALAPAGIALLSGRHNGDRHERGWFALAMTSLVLQGLGAFIAKLVVAPAGPSDLLMTSAAVQVVVGLVIAPPRDWSPADLSGRPALYTIVAYAAAGIGTLAYLSALAVGPAAVVVPLVATSPALAGIGAILVLKESAPARQVAGIAVALGGTLLLASQG